MKSSEFSRFIRTATPEEKEKVYKKVMEEACKSQRKVMDELHR